MNTNEELERNTFILASAQLDDRFIRVQDVLNLAVFV